VTGPARWKLPPRRCSRALRMIWHAPDGTDRAFHMHIGFDKGPLSPATFPGEIFITPSTRAGRGGSMVHFHSHDAAESVSLLLQHGHQIADLRERYKRGSLLRCALEWAWLECDAIHADVPPLPGDLPKTVLVHWRRLCAEDETAEQAKRDPRGALANAVRHELRAMGIPA